MDLQALRDPAVLGIIGIALLATIKVLMGWLQG